MKKLQDDLLANKVAPPLPGSRPHPLSQSTPSVSVHTLCLCPSLALVSLQDQLIAELERMQLELDQLRSRPGGAYSR